MFMYTPLCEAKRQSMGHIRVLDIGSDTVAEIAAAIRTLHIANSDVPTSMKKTDCISDFVTFEVEISHDSFGGDALNM